MVTDSCPVEQGHNAFSKYMNRCQPTLISPTDMSQNCLLLDLNLVKFAAYPRSILHLIPVGRMNSVVT